MAKAQAGHERVGAVGLDGVQRRLVPDDDGIRAGRADTIRHRDARDADVARSIAGLDSRVLAPRASTT